MSDAIIMIKFEDGNAFRWNISEKYAWKLFFDKWKGSIISDAPKDNKEKNAKPARRSRDKNDDEFSLD